METLSNYRQMFEDYADPGPANTRVLCKEDVFEIFPKISNDVKLNAWDLIHATDISFVFCLFFFVTNTNRCRSTRKKTKKTKQKKRGNHRV